MKMDLLMLAENLSENGGFRPPHMGEGGFGPFSILVIQMLIVAAALLILWWMLRSHYKRTMFNKNDTPIDILNKRYAAGELTKEEYAQLKKDVGVK